MTNSQITLHLNAGSGSITLHTSRAGIGAKVGHDLTIGVTEWSATVSADLAEPEAATVALEIAVDSLTVLKGDGGLKALTDGDKAEIAATIRKKILHTQSHPNITFVSTKVTGTATAYSVTGDLTICGVTRSVTLAGSVTPDGAARGECVLIQSDFGIKPYSAMLGALKLADEVIIRYDLAAPALLGQSS